MQNFNAKLENWDKAMIMHMKRWSMPMARFAIFLVYFWFGILKVLGTSPANPLVDALLAQTLPGVTFAQFIVAFGVVEMLIGIMFLVSHLTRLAIFVLCLHLITTIMPLFVLREATWQSFLVPTLEGQYIIKNILIVAAAVGILAHTHILKKEGK